jgi:hypothetical protein
MDGWDMAQDKPVDGGAEAERHWDEAMEEFEEMLRRIITAPPKT